MVGKSVARRMLAKTMEDDERRWGGGRNTGHLGYRDTSSNVRRGRRAHVTALLDRKMP